ncbi:MAG: RNA methyltransferase [Anaerolineales bacterium]|jgi:TrmH family RNA methyltransferase
MALISSHQNPKIKQVRALSHRKQRDKQGLFLVEGIRHVGEAVDAGTELDYVLYASEVLVSDYAHSLIQRLTATGTPCFDTSIDTFAALSSKDHPQGILAVARQNLSSLEMLNPENFPWGVALVAPQDPGNLGTILRTVDAVGASGLIVLDNGVDIFHPTAVRASMGALFWKPVVYTPFKDFTAWTQENSYHVCGSSARGNTKPEDVNYQTPAILLMGSEREGLGGTQAEICEAVVRLPMRGKSTSLNLSVAAGILLYHMAEQLIEK